MIRCKSLVRGALLCAGLAIGGAGCSHPSEAGSKDPHGTYTPEQAQAAAQEALKSRNLAKPGGAHKPNSPATGSTSATGTGGTPQAGN